MLSKRSITALSVAEGQLLRQQWIGSGKCARCFHASVSRRVEGDAPQGSAQASSDGTPPTTPQRGPTRHQRAAMVSEEVRQLNRSGPSQAVTDGADSIIGSAGIDRDDVASTPQMGANSPPEQEGLLAQGGGESMRSYNDVLAGGRTRQAQTGKEGNAAKVGRAQDVEGGQPAGAHDATTQSDTSTRTFQPSSTNIAPSTPRLRPAGPPFVPIFPTLEALTLPSVSTIAAANVQNVLHHRLQTVAEPDLSPTTPRNINHLAQRLLKHHIVRFASPAEKEVVLAECVRLTGRGAKMTDQVKGAKGPDDPPYWAPLPGQVRQNFVGKMVNGVYDKEGLLEGKQRHRQPLLNEIEKVMMRNGTYLTKDTERVLKKVRSLLPTVQAGQQQRGAAQRQALKK